MQRLVRRWRTEGVRIGFVPTMGYLHEGHVSLVQRARRAVGGHGRLVVSIYVNPTQFGPREDLNKYPRDLPRDLRLCRQADVDVVFVPRDDEMYPGGLGGDPTARSFSTYVTEEKLSRGMESLSRPTHFRGVTTGWRSCSTSCNRTWPFERRIISRPRWCNAWSAT
jgi:pantoate--beta-alanine ligase